jgi:hypothetical protein
MKATKDQKDLNEVLAFATEARDEAYSLFSRRLDTQRNVESFIGLRDAFMLLKDACDTLQKAALGATETKSSNKLSVANEIMVRSGRATVVQDCENISTSKKLAIVLPFPIGN